VGIDRRRLTTTLPDFFIFPKTFLNTYFFLYIMSRQDKIQMPSSGAGIMRYFDDYKSKIEFKPEHVVILTILVIVVIIVLHLTGTR
jgi:preprotein translocase subunit Sec61beta